MTDLKVALIKQTKFFIWLFQPIKPIYLTQKNYSSALDFAIFAS